MDTTRFERLVDEATTGLHADRELHMDVRQELHGHLQDKAEAFQRKGHTDEESTDLAAQWFGSPLEMAQELQQANLRRMQWRARVRVLLTWVAIPLAIVVALLFGFRRVATVITVGSGFSQQMTGTDSSFPLPFVKPYRPVKEVIPQHDAEMIKAYWEQHRDEEGSERYYAYYVANVIRRPSDATEGGDIAEVTLAACREGERIEPDNALYPILAASILLERGLQKGEEGKYTPTIQDRSAFEAGTDALLRAASKPMLENYRTTIMRERLNAYPEPRYFEEYIALISVAAAEIFPECGRYRDVAKLQPVCAQALINAGRHDEAIKVLDAWKPLVRVQLANYERKFIIEELVTVASGLAMAEGVQAPYRQLGYPEKAEEAAQIFAALKASKSNNFKSELDVAMPRHGSILANIISPVFSKLEANPQFDASAFTASRMAEHVLLEEGMIILIIALLLLAMLGSLLGILLWHSFNRKRAAASLLLIPSAKQLGNMLFFGVVVPILAYYLYSRLPVIGGREYGWRHMGWRFGVEFAVLTLVMLNLLAFFVRRYIRQRCDDLSISVPDARRDHRHALIVPLGLTVTIVFAVATYKAVVSPAASDQEGLWLFFGTIGSIIITAILHNLSMRRQGYGMYYGSLARSSAPVYALAIILLSVVVQPVLQARESYWLRKDQFMFGTLADRDSTPCGCTAIEAEVCKQYGKRLLEIMDGKGHAR